MRRKRVEEIKKDKKRGDKIIEYSLGLLKPDCIQRGLVETILAIVKATELEIVAIKTLTLTKKDVEIFYEDSRNDDYFDDHSQFMQSGSVTAFIVKGENAIEILNELVGSTEPSKAKAGTIRSVGIDICRNLVHSSDSRLAFLREARVIFDEQELKDIGIM